MACFAQGFELLRERPISEQEPLRGNISLWGPRPFRVLDYLLEGWGNVAFHHYLTSFRPNRGRSKPEVGDAVPVDHYISPGACRTTRGSCTVSEWRPIDV